MKNNQKIKIANFRKYLELLDRGSESFNLMVKEIREKFNINLNKASLCKNAKALNREGAVLMLMKRFFMKNTPEYYEIVATYLIDGTTYDKCDVRYFTDRNLPVVHKIEESCIMVKLYAPISKDDWAAIYDEYLSKENDFFERWEMSHNDLAVYRMY